MKPKKKIDELRIYCEYELSCSTPGGSFWQGNTNALKGVLGKIKSLDQEARAHRLEEIKKVCNVREGISHPYDAWRDGREHGRHELKQEILEIINETREEARED